MNMKSTFILTIIFAIAVALEDRDDKEKRDTSEDYHNDQGPTSGGHGGRAVSYSEVIHRIPTRNFNSHSPNFNSHSSNFNQFHHPQQFPIGRSSLPVKVPLPYPVLLKRVPLLVDRPVVPVAAVQPSFQNFVITKVPLVYHTSYGDQPQQDYSHFSPSVAVGRNYAEEHY